MALTKGEGGGYQTLILPPLISRESYKGKEKRGGKITNADALNQVGVVRLKRGIEDLSHYLQFRCPSNRGGEEGPGTPKYLFRLTWTERKGGKALIK